MELVEFLLARIAEDEEAMGRIAGRQWYACDDGHVQEPEIDDRDVLLEVEPEAQLPNHHNSWALVLDPARVLAECAAKRRLIRWVNQWPMRPHPPSSVDGVLELLAQPYADHPDYRQEWAQ
jgi:hypothetical protein